MSDRTLNAAHVASLLISASCGIGFLFGTGELALRTGMAGSLYAVATAAGLAMLSLRARSLWTTGLSIWDRLGCTYGPSVGRTVAFLSLTWMTGVLAAQIRGGTAIISLAGLSRLISLVTIDGLIVALSFIRLRWLSACIACCLVGSNLALLDVLARTGGFGIFLHAPLLFLSSMQQMSCWTFVATTTAITFLVVSGADYQQFVISARHPGAARKGCAMAAAILFVIGFLPASAVIAAKPIWHLDNLPDAAQVVPVMLDRALGRASMVAQHATLGVLVAAALGSACAILRAMTAAVETLAPAMKRHHLATRLTIIAISSIVAARGQTIVGTMVALNIVYISSIGVLFILREAGIFVSPADARRSMAAGFIVAVTLYAGHWIRLIDLSEQTAFLMALAAAFAVLIPPLSSRMLRSERVKEHYRRTRQRPTSEAMIERAASSAKLTEIPSRPRARISGMLRRLDKAFFRVFGH